MRLRRRAVLVALMTAGCGKLRRPPPPLVWFDGVDRAYAEAKRTARPLLLTFVATWDCGSKELEHHTFPDPEVASLLSAGFVCASVDCSDDEDERTSRLMRQFDIKGVPTLVVTDESRRDLWRMTQYTKPDELAVVLRATRARYDAMRDIDAALRLGEAWRRPVLLFFAPAYDHGSMEVRRNCLGDRNVAGLIRDSFVFVDAPCDEGWNDEWDRFGVRGTPTSIVIDAARRVELARVEENVGPRAYERFLDVGLGRFRPFSRVIRSRNAQGIVRSSVDRLLDLFERRHE